MVTSIVVRDKKRITLPGEVEDSKQCERCYIVVARQLSSTECIMMGSLYCTFHQLRIP